MGSFLEKKQQYNFDSIIINENPFQQSSNTTKKCYLYIKNENMLILSTDTDNNNIVGLAPDYFSFIYNNKPISLIDTHFIRPL